LIFAAKALQTGQPLLGVQDGFYEIGKIGVVTGVGIDIRRFGLTTVLHLRMNIPHHVMAFGQRY
jgi:hypothetical protein